MNALEILKYYKDLKLKTQKQRDLDEKCFAYVNSRVDGEVGQLSNDIRSQLKEQGRPEISFNIVRKFVNRICGAQVQLRLDEKAYPRDDQSDPMTGEILTDLIKYAKDINDGEIAIARMFRDGIICGRGFIKTEWSNEYDPFGEICIKSIPPDRVYILGDGEEYDISKDRKGIIEEIPMDKEEIKLRWGKDEEIDALTDDLDEKDDIPIAEDLDYDFGKAIPSELIWDKEDRKLKVLRCQRIKRKKVNFLFNQNTKELLPAPEKPEDLQLVQEASQASGEVLEPKSQVQKYVEVTYSVGNVLLEQTESPYKYGEYDITGFFAYIDNGIITGVVQDLLDPQDEKNKRRSQAIHMLGTAAKNSHWIKKGAVDDINETTKKLGKVGQGIEVNGDPSTVTRPIESNMTAVPALIQMELQSHQDMREISGLSDASLGIVPEGVKSGRGIQALQLPSETIVAELFNHLLMSRKIVARKILALIQQYYTEERRVRILGDYTAKILPPEVQKMREMIQTQAMAANPLISQEDAVLMSDQMVQVLDGSKLLTINKEILGKKLNDVTVGRYDVVIDQVSSSPTMRQQQYQDMLNLKALGVPIPDEVLIKYSDIRGKEEILQKLEETRALMLQMNLLMNQKPQKATPPKEPQAADAMVNMGGQF